MFSLEEFNDLGLDKMNEIISHKAEILDRFNTEESKVLIYVYNAFIIVAKYSLAFETLKSIQAMTELEAAEKFVKLKGKLNLER